MKTIESGRISGYQLIGLLFMIRLVPRTLLCPTPLIGAPVRDMWLADLLSGVLAVCFVLAVTDLGNRNPGKTTIEYARLHLGWFAGKLVGLFLTLYFVIVAATTARNLAESFSISIMPRTPIVVFIVLLLFLTASIARNGLETVARTGEILFPLILLLMFALILLPADLMRFERLRPVLTRGWSSVVALTSVEFSFYLEFIIIGMIFPHVNRPTEGTRFALFTVVFTSVLLAIMCVAMIAIFGPTTDAISLQAFQLARVIQLGEFFERIEALVLAAWVLATGVKLAILTWASALSLSQFMELKTYRPVVYPVAALTAVLSISLFEDVVVMSRFIAIHWTQFVIPSLLLMVVTLLVATYLRGGETTP